MSNKYFHVITFVLASISIFIASDEASAKESKKIEQLLVDTANEINKQLPMTLDGDTRLDTIIAYKKTFRYKCTLTNTVKGQTNSTVFKKMKEPELINNLCTTKNTRILLNGGVTFIYLYYDKHGKEMMQLEVDSSKCRL
jgi:hypothetical protein